MGKGGNVWAAVCRGRVRRFTDTHPAKVEGQGRMIAKRLRFSLGTPSWEKYRPADHGISDLLGSLGEGSGEKGITKKGEKHQKPANPNRSSMGIRRQGLAD